MRAVHLQYPGADDAGGKQAPIGHPTPPHTVRAEPDPVASHLDATDPLLLRDLGLVPYAYQPERGVREKSAASPATMIRVLESGRSTKPSAAERARSDGRAASPARAWRRDRRRRLPPRTAPARSAPSCRRRPRTAQHEVERRERHPGDPDRGQSERARQLPSASISRGVARVRGSSGATSVMLVETRSHPSSRATKVRRRRSRTASTPVTRQPCDPHWSRGSGSARRRFRAVSVTTRAESNASEPSKGRKVTSLTRGGRHRRFDAPPPPRPSGPAGPRRPRSQTRKATTAATTRASSTQPTNRSSD